MPLLKCLLISIIILVMIYFYIYDNGNDIIGIISLIIEYYIYNNQSAIFNYWIKISYINSIFGASIRRLIISITAIPFVLDQNPSIFTLINIYIIRYFNHVIINH